MAAYAVFGVVTLTAVAVVVVLATLSTRAIQTADDLDRFSPGALAANVIATHGVIGAVIAGAAWYADIPGTVLGIGVPGMDAVGIGVLVGVGLAAANEAAQRVVARIGIDHDETLRGLLTPHSRSGWVVLLVVALPTVAVVEELLFRAAVIGALAAGFGFPVWWLAAASSAAFGLGHGLQGPGGIVVTVALGFVLAATFVATGSLAAVAIAHYVVNAAEFLAHSVR